MSIKSTIQSYSWPVEPSIVPGDSSGNINYERIPSKEQQALMVMKATNRGYWRFFHRPGRIAPELFYYSKKNNILWLLKLTWARMDYERISNRSSSPGLFYSLLTLKLADDFKRANPSLPPIRYLCLYLHGTDGIIWVDSIKYRVTGQPGHLKLQTGKLGDFGTFLHIDKWNSIKTLNKEIRAAVKPTIQPVVDNLSHLDEEPSFDQTPTRILSL